MRGAAEFFWRNQSNAISDWRARGVHDLGNRRRSRGIHMGDDVAWLHGGGLLGLSPQAPTSDRIAPLGNIRSLSRPSGGFCPCAEINSEDPRTVWEGPRSLRRYIAESLGRSVRSVMSGWA